MSLDAMVAGMYGQVPLFTVNDVDTGTAINLSSFTTIEVELKAPDGSIATKTASFNDDGGDGVISYTWADGDIHTGGKWHVRGKASKTGQVLYSKWKEFDVEE